MAGEQDRISPKAAAAIVEDDSAIVVSAVVVWEVAIKRRLGKLDAPADLRLSLERAGVDLLSIDARHAERVGTLPMHHRDPFDRLLVAQAEIGGHTLVSGDAVMRDYDIDVLW